MKGREGTAAAVYVCSKLDSNRELQDVIDDPAISKEARVSSRAPLQLPRSKLTGLASNSPTTPTSVVISSRFPPVK